MSYQSPPDPSEVDWNIQREGRAWEDGEVRPRYDMAAEKIELICGKLFWTDEERLRMLGLLLENCGAEAAVHMGDPDVWRRAVAALDSPESQLEYAVKDASRRRDRLSDFDPEGAVRFFEQVTAPDYVECGTPGSAAPTAARQAILEGWSDKIGKRTDASSDRKGSSVDRVRVDGNTGTAMITTRSDRPARRDQPAVVTIERWRETWQHGEAGWRLQKRECLERFVT
jgi:hypothetical protein